MSRPGGASPAPTWRPRSPGPITRFFQELPGRHRRRRRSPDARVPCLAGDTVPHGRPTANPRLPHVCPMATSRGTRGHGGPGASQQLRGTRRHRRGRWLLQLMALGDTGEVGPCPLGDGAAPATVRPLPAGGFAGAQPVPHGPAVAGDGLGRNWCAPNARPARCGDGTGTWWQLGTHVFTPGLCSGAFRRLLGELRCHRLRAQHVAGSTLPVPAPPRQAEPPGWSPVARPCRHREDITAAGSCCRVLGPASRRAGSVRPRCHPALHKRPGSHVSFPLPRHRPVLARARPGPHRDSALVRSRPRRLLRGGAPPSAQRRPAGLDALPFPARSCRGYFYRGRGALTRLDPAPGAGSPKVPRAAPPPRGGVPTPTADYTLLSPGGTRLRIRPRPDADGRGHTVGSSLTPPGALLPPPRVCQPPTCPAAARRGSWRCDFLPSRPKSHCQGFPTGASPRSQDARVRRDGAEGGVGGLVGVVGWFRGGGPRGRGAGLSPPVNRVGTRVVFTVAKFRSPVPSRPDAWVSCPQVLDPPPQDLRTPPGRQDPPRALPPVPTELICSCFG